MFKRLKARLAGQEVTIHEGVVLPRHKKQPACMLLNTADRFAAIFGKPAKELYLSIVKDYELWTHSYDEELGAAYHDEYVYKTGLMWWELSGMIPGPGRVEEPPIYQARPSDEVFLQQQQYRLQIALNALQSWKEEAMRRFPPGVLPPTGRTREDIWREWVIRLAGGIIPLKRTLDGLVFLMPFATIEQWNRGIELYKWYASLGFTVF